MKRQGVDLRLGDAVAAFEPGPQETITVVAQHDERFTADLVILAVGVQPDTKLARAAGLEIGPTGGIRVDDQMRTSDPHIFAVGDAVEVRDFVTGRPALIPLAGPANRQGRIAADVICGRDAHFRGSQGTAVVGVFDLTLAMTGETEKSLRRAGIAFEKSYVHPTHHASYYPGAERISLKLLFSPDSGRVLGAQAVGRAGVEKRIDVMAMAIQMKATVFDLEEAELCYAPQYGSAKDPVNMAGFVAANILRGDVRVGHWSEWKRRQAAGRRPADARRSPRRRPWPPRRSPARSASPSASFAPGSASCPATAKSGSTASSARPPTTPSGCSKQHGFKVRNLSGGITSYKMEA